MDLICWLPGSQIQDPRTPTYLAAKRYYLDLEISGVLSIQGLQAGIFIALFELGHANTLRRFCLSLLVPDMVLPWD